MDGRKARFIPMTRELEKLRTVAARVIEVAGGRMSKYVSDQMGRRMFPDVSIVSDDVPRGIGFTRWPDGTISVAGDPVGQRGWVHYSMLFFNYLGAIIAKEAVESKMKGKAGEPTFEGDIVRLHVELDDKYVELMFEDGLYVRAESDRLDEEDLEEGLRRILYWLMHPSIREGTVKS